MVKINNVREHVDISNNQWKRAFCVGTKNKKEFKE